MNNQTLICLDLFCGSGGGTTGMLEAAGQLGLQMDVLAVNHWPVAIATHETNHPNVRHICENLECVWPRQVVPGGKVHLAIMAPECFPAGTLILTKSGLVPIEEVREGDFVLTHKGRYRCVTSRMKTLKKTIKIRGQGHFGLLTTREHPFLCAETRRNHRPVDGRLKRLLEPKWVSASEIVGKYWATPTQFELIPVPKVEITNSGVGSRSAKKDGNYNEDFWWMIGRWLGDGSITFRRRTAEISICCSFGEADDLETRLKLCDWPLNWKRRNLRTATIFEARHLAFGEWLLKHFGRYSYGKTIPAWALSMKQEFRASLLEGYLSADGHETARTVGATTVSKSLAIGIRLLAESLGHRVSISPVKARQSASIEGRAIVEREQYALRWVKSRTHQYNYETELHSWSPVKSYESHDGVWGKPSTVVYNISVEEDESYIAEGIVVHNCTSHSRASGGRPKSEQSRATAWHVIRWAEELDIENILVENVQEFCFPSETAVLSKRGIVPIGELVIGDEVWTHNARWKPVSAIVRRRASTVRIKGYGNTIVESTPNHRFYAREIAACITKSGKRGRHKARFLEPEWVRADQLSVEDSTSSYSRNYSGYAWASPTELPRYWMRLPRTLGVDASTPDFFYMIGRWLGDGWVKIRKGKQDLVRICANNEEANELEERLARTGLTWHRSRHSPSVEIFDLSAAASRILIPWLRANFNEYAHKKTLPTWVFGAPESLRWALIEGYYAADGHEQAGGVMAAVTVSRCLAVGMRLLLQSLGIAASVSSRPASLVPGITNPEVMMETREAFTVSWRREVFWEKCSRSDLHLWGRVREVVSARDDVEVVDITVEDDHSFIADGQVVHNCDWGPLYPDDHPNEKLRGRPIPEKKGAFFRDWIGSLRKRGYRCEYRVLNAAYFGATTSRTRFFLQAKKIRDGKRPKITWPETTHDKSENLFGKPKFRAAREIIDWDLPGQSVFNRKRPLAPNTMRRVFAGLEKFSGLPFLMGQQSCTAPRSTDDPVPTVATAGAISMVQPFLVIFRGSSNGASVESPLGTITTTGKHHYLAQPFVVPVTHAGDVKRVVDLDKPFPTVTGAHGGEFALVAPYLVKYHGSHRNRQDCEKRVYSVEEPLKTLDTQPRFGIAEPYLVSYKGTDNAKDLEEPLDTLTTRDRFALCEPFVLPPEGIHRGNVARPLDGPMQTLTGRGGGHVVQPFIVPYYGNSEAISIDDPLDTVTTRDRFALVAPEMVEVYGIDKGDIVGVLDIRFRMLQPHELSAAMGFPSDYQFTGTKEQKTKQIGNAIEVNMARALCREMLQGYAPKPKIRRKKSNGLPICASVKCQRCALSNKTDWPEIVPVTFITDEEAAERGIELPPLPTEHDLNTLTRRTLWQNWGRDTGGWTHAIRLHPCLPLVKFAISAERGYYANFFDGRCWIVEEHSCEADCKGEKGELGLGMGSPFLAFHMGAGETPYPDNRAALSAGRGFVEWMLFECDREAWADVLCADLIEDNGNPTDANYHREELFGWWKKHLQSTKQGYQSALYEREAALAVTPYIAATYDQKTVFEALSAVGLSGHEAGEAMKSPRKYEEKSYI